MVAQSEEVSAPRAPRIEVHGPNPAQPIPAFEPSGGDQLLPRVFEGIEHYLVHRQPAVNHCVGQIRIQIVSATSRRRVHPKTATD